MLKPNTTAAPRNHVVIVENHNNAITYLGKFDGEGELRGVRDIDNAVRYTERGAKRVANAYKMHNGERGQILKVG